MIQGSIVAIVTPMRADGSLDYPRLKSLVDFHVAEGTDGIVIVGGGIAFIIAVPILARRRRWARQPSQ